MHAPTLPPKEGRPSISLVLPAWNEATVIADAVHEADAALRQVTDCYEIIVVDDGSTDQTADIVDAIAGQNDSVRLIRHTPNQGYGAAIRSGFAAAEKDLVVFTDADCQFDLTELDRFVLLAERYDIVCGYRIDRKDTALRCLYSKVYNLLVQTLLGTGVRDVDCAFKLFHRDVARGLKITGNGFLVNSEMLVQANQQQRSVVEVGVTHRPRTLGESTVSIRHIPKVLVSLARFWWNEVQFAGVPAGDVTQGSSDCQSTLPDASGSTRWPKCLASSTAKYRCMQIALLLVAMVFLFSNLGYPLIDRDETRYAEIPREMIATGNWILPQLNFQTYYDKPPMLYWLCAISYQVLGVSETAARVVPALSAFAMIAMTMFFGARIFDRWVGLVSGAVLMLSVGFAFTSRYLLLDGLLSLFVSMSLFSAYEAVRPRHRKSSGRQRLKSVGGRNSIRLTPRLQLRWWLLSAVCIGLAFLTKGPIAIVLWLPPVFAFTWLSDTYVKPRWWHYGVLGGVAAMVAVPWFVAVSRQDPTFLVEFFYTHNVARFAGEFHSRPIWYFVPVLLIAGHPWSFLAVPYIRFLFGRTKVLSRQRPPAVGFLLLWSAWCFVFFSVSQCKLPTYLLPAAPALALMIGHYLGQVLRDADESSRHFFARFWSARTATATTCLAGVGFVGYAILATPDVSVYVYAWAMLWTSLLVAAVLMINDRYQVKIAWATSAGVMFMFAVMIMHEMVPAYSRSETLFGESSPLAEQLSVDKQPAIATVDHEFSEVPFYLDRRNISHFANVTDRGLSDFVSQNRQCYLIVEEGIASQAIRARLPSGRRLVEVAQRGVARVYQVQGISGAEPQIAETQAPVIMEVLR